MLSDLEVKQRAADARVRYGIDWVLADNLPPEVRYRILGKTVYVNGKKTPNEAAAALVEGLAEVAARLDGSNVVPFVRREAPHRYGMPATWLAVGVAAASLFGVAVAPGGLLDPSTTGQGDWWIELPGVDAPRGRVLMPSVGDVVTSIELVTAALTPLGTPAEYSMPTVEAVPSMGAQAGVSDAPAPGPLVEQIPAVGQVPAMAMLPPVVEPPPPAPPVELPVLPPVELPAPVVEVLPVVELPPAPVVEELPPALVIESVIEELLAPPVVEPVIEALPVVELPPELVAEPVIEPPPAPLAEDPPAPPPVELDVPVIEELPPAPVVEDLLSLPVVEPAIDLPPPPIVEEPVLELPVVIEEPPAEHLLPVVEDLPLPVEVEAAQELAAEETPVVEELPPLPVELPAVDLPVEVSPWFEAQG